MTPEQVNVMVRGLLLKVAESCERMSRDPLLKSVTGDKALAIYALALRQEYNLPDAPA